MAAVDVDNLRQFLAGEGFDLPEAANAALQAYVDEGFYFFVAKYADLPAAPNHVTPVRFRFPRTGPSFTYPMRLTPLSSAAALDLQLFVIADGDLSIEGASTAVPDLAGVTGQDGYQSVLTRATAAPTLYKECAGSIASCSGGLLKPTSYGMAPEMLDATDGWVFHRLFGHLSMAGPVQDIKVTVSTSKPYDSLVRVPLDCSCAGGGTVPWSATLADARRGGCGAGTPGAGPGVGVLLALLAAGLLSRRGLVAALVALLIGCAGSGGGGASTDVLGTDGGDVEVGLGTNDEAGVPLPDEGPPACLGQTAYWFTPDDGTCDGAPGFSICGTSRKTLKSLVAFGDELFVAGREGTAFHRKDGRWEWLCHPGMQYDSGRYWYDLYGVFGYDPEHVWFSSDGGLFRWDGASISQVPFDATVPGLGGAAGPGRGMASPDGTLIIASQSHLYRFDGSSWDQIPLGSPPSATTPAGPPTAWALSGLLGTPDDLRVGYSRGAGADGEDFLGTWNGHAWTFVQIPRDDLPQWVQWDLGGGRTLVGSYNGPLKIVDGTTITEITLASSIHDGRCDYALDAPRFTAFAHVEGVGDVLATDGNGLFLLEGSVARSMGVIDAAYSLVQTASGQVYGMDYTRIFHLPIAAPTGFEAEPAPPDHADCAVTDCRVTAGPYCDPDSGKRDAVDKDFRLDRWEVTNGQFQAFLADPAGTAWVPGPSQAQWYLWDWSHGAPRPDRVDHPAAFVSAAAAQAYCAWQGGRLPTRAEFLRASTAGTLARFPWGNAPMANAANLRGGGDPFERDGFPETTPVGLFDGTSHGGFATTLGASPFGIFDLLGNVAELVTAPDGIHECGGSWWTPAAALQRAAPLPCPVAGEAAWGVYEPAGLPTASWMSRGFRCARDVD